ncbi:MAG: VOC family protein [Anaerolineae bacterium]|nr:VOC family protein [Anaerolineae bacterium]
MINRLAVTEFWVTDQNAALRFYTETLGFDIRADVTVGDYRWISVGLKSQPDVEIGLNALKAGNLLTADEAQFLTKLVEAGKLGHCVWKTDDCHKTYDELKAKGVEFVQPPTDRPYGTIEAIFKDNSGNIMVLSQDKR